MNQPPHVYLAECRCDADGEAQEPRYLQRPWKNSIESFATRVFEQKRHLPLLLRKSQRPNRERGVQLIPQRIFVLEFL